MRWLSIPVAAIMLVSCAAVMAIVPTEVAAHNTKVGNYWNYYWETEYPMDDTGTESVSLTGTVKVNVTGTDRAVSGGAMKDVFLVRTTASATLYGNLVNMSVSGSFQETTVLRRLTTDFSLVRSDRLIDMEITAGFFSIPMSYGYEMSIDPAQDDYLEDEYLTLGHEYFSQSLFYGDVWVEAFGDRTSETMSNDTSMIIRVVETNVSITTSAGTFMCDEVTINETTDGTSQIVTGYFSQEVGNFVKTEGTGEPMAGAIRGGLSLTSYSYSADATPPTADAGPDQTVHVGDLVVFDATGSDDNVGIVSYEWTFDDGGNKTLSGTGPRYTFNVSGTYMVNLTVMDAGGNSANDSVIITVKGRGIVGVLSDNLSLTLGLMAALVIAALITTFALRARRKRIPPTAMPPVVPTSGYPPLQPPVPPPAS